MERYVFLSVLGFSLLAVVIGVFLVPGQRQGEAYLPWQVETTPQGNTRVFGVEIGRSTLLDVERTFQEVSELSLFESEDGHRVIEAYFDTLDISGLRARAVLVMEMEQSLLDQMYQRGERKAHMGGGRYKITLTEADAKTVKQATFSSLSYIPKHNLNAELVTARFGEPAERIAEKGRAVEHWLYPSIGLDIALDPKEKEVLQYVRPSHFELVRRPLLEQATAQQPGG